jgi:uracil-DNA glycosylase family 4
MKPTGSEHPLVYMLGDAPNAADDKHNEPFVGRGGFYLRNMIPRDIRSRLRWSNVVRTRPENNETPDQVAIECCRPSILEDVEKTKPRAIFGFGALPLKWATNLSGVSLWTGRHLPVKIGNHVCWYFPFYHPSYILHLDHDSTRQQYESMDFLFRLHLRNAFELLDQLPEPKIHTPAQALEDIECVYSMRGITNALEQLWGDPVIGIDLETTKIRPYNNDAQILSIALSGQSATYSFGLLHPETIWTEEELDKISQMLFDFLLNSPGRKVVFTPFELEWLGWLEPDLIFSCKWDDAQAQAYILDERLGAFSLNNLCIQHFGLELKAISNTDVTKLKQTPLGEVLRYNGMDAKYHRHLYEVQTPLIKANKLWEVYRHHIDRAKAATLIQLHGIPVNQEVVRSYETKYQTALTEIEAEIAKLPVAKAFTKKHHHPYRPTAVKDVKEIFTSIGEHVSSAQQSEIERIDHPLAKLHLKWKHIAKVLSTYVIPCKSEGETSELFADGRLHPLLSLIKTRTWRTSSESVNIQNFPKHGDGVEVRNMISAPPGYSIVSFDYGQIQVRCVAMESHDKALVKSFWDRYDIYNEWRDHILDWYPEWISRKDRDDKNVMKVFRQKTKGAVLGRLFGAGGRKLATHLLVPEHIGYQFVEEFNDAFPGVHNWQKGLHDLYARKGYVSGLSGYRRRAPIAHTEVINTPIQSNEAIIVCDAMIRVAKAGFIPMMMVHDDLTFLWETKDVDRNAEQVISILLNCPLTWTHVVPITVEMSIGKTWATTKPREHAHIFESDRWRGSL